MKFDGSLHRSAEAADLGTTDDGRWLFIGAGTRVIRPGRGDYDHPCDAVTLIPAQGLWTATWLIEWDPALYVDVALHQRSERHDHVVTVDLDVDIVRRRNGEVELLDQDEFELHRRLLGYPGSWSPTCTEPVNGSTWAILRHEPPFLATPGIRPATSAPAERHQTPG